MHEPTPPTRFTESRLGRLAGILLALVILISMACSTGMVHTHVPAIALLLGVVLLALIGLLLGYRFPRIPLMAWLSLAVGGYFYWRASSSYSQLEGANAMALVMGAAVFYVAGIYYGLSKRADAAMAVFAALLLAINALYWYFARGAGLSLIWWGRPDVGITGLNSGHTALLLYKNFACVFFASAGVYLIARCLWLGFVGSWSLLRGLGLVLGVGGLVISFHCGSRAAFLLLPLLAFVAYVLRLLLRAASQLRMRWFDWGFMLVAIAGFGALIFDFAGEQKIWASVNGVNTHLRTLIWRYLMEQVPAAPWCGFGAGASQWEIIPYFYEWFTPNYAHNEYLQAWVDYGLFGLTCMLFILLWHWLRALVSLSDSRLSAERRVQVAGALLLLMGISAYAFVDFPWHQFSLLCQSAFLCGVLASPRGEEARLISLLSAKDSPPSPTRPEQGWRRLALALTCLALLVGLGSQLWRFAPAWRADWQYKTIATKGGSHEQEMQLLEEVVTYYPEADVVNWYLSLPYPRSTAGYAKLADMMAPCIAANPKNLFAVALQSDFLGRIGQYEEAESLLRESYVRGGMTRQNLTSWPTYYGMNLLRWGNYYYVQGQWAKAYSLLTYAYRMHRHSALTYNLDYRGSHQFDMQAYRRAQSERNKNLSQLMKNLQKNLQFMEKIGIKADDSWKEPMREGGSGPLYQNWGNKPFEKKK